MFILIKFPFGKDIHSTRNYKIVTFMMTRGLKLLIDFMLLLLVLNPLLYAVNPLYFNFINLCK